MRTSCCSDAISSGLVRTMMPPGRPSSRGCQERVRMLVTAFGLRATARTSRFRRLQSVDGIAVIPPAIDAADQLLDAESELEHVKRAFFRAVTTDPITVRNDQGRSIQVGRRGVAHRSMRDIRRAGNMALSVGFR